MALAGFVFLTAGLTSCSKSELGRTQQQQQQPPSEEKQQIDAFWSKKVSGCGGSNWYIGYDNGQISHLRNARWTVQFLGVSPADAQNGVQWHGVTTLEADTTRNYISGGWQGWEQGTGFGIFNVEVTKRNGRWNFAVSSFSAINQMFALPCEKVPRDLTAQEVRQIQNTTQSRYCDLAIHPGNSLGAVRAYLDSGFDANACRDAVGRTLLMLVASRGDIGDLDSLLGAGAELNAKDNRGWTALNYAVNALRLNQSDTSHQITVQKLQTRGGVLGVGSGPPHTGKPCNWNQILTPRNDYQQAMRNVDTFLTNGGDLTCLDSSGNTLVHWYAAYGWWDVIQNALQHGVDVNARNNDGQTALDLAILSMNRADPNEKYQLSKLVDQLRRYGAKTASEIGSGGSPPPMPHQPVDKPNVSEGAPTRTYATASSVLPPQGTNRYAADQVLDGQLGTAWVEGKPGPGIGEWVEVGFPDARLVSAVRIFPGYGKSDVAFKSNNRPKRLRLQFFSGATQDITLEDAMTWQTFRLSSPQRTLSVRFIILEVYRGSKWDDTAISEIEIQ